MVACMHDRPHSAEARRKMSLSKQGQHSSPGTEFTPGHAPWNAGKGVPYMSRPGAKGRIPWNKGMKLPHLSGPNHHAWKGDAVGLAALHDWVVRHKGTPQQCDHCGTTDRKWYDWANKSHEYKRDLDDWLRLCRSCHRRHDAA
jgi:hypothetical protein